MPKRTYCQLCLKEHIVKYVRKNILSIMSERTYCQICQKKTYFQLYHEEHIVSYVRKNTVNYDRKNILSSMSERTVSFRDIRENDRFASFRRTNSCLRVH